MLDRFYRTRKFDDAIAPFWDMYRRVSEALPAEIEAEAKKRSIEYRALSHGKILARFCRGFGDITHDAQELFDRVVEMVDSELMP